MLQLPLLYWAKECDGKRGVGQLCQFFYNPAHFVILYECSLTNFPTIRANLRDTPPPFSNCR